MTEMLSLLGEKFVQDALKAALLVAVLCSYLGVFVVLKRIVFVGAALAEVASLGAGLAFSPAALWVFNRIAEANPALEPLRHFKPLVLAVLLMLAAVSIFSQPRLMHRMPREAVIGAAFAGAAGLTVLVLSKVPVHDQHASDVLTGNILGVEPQELTEMAIVSVLVGLIQLLFYKEFVLISFDPEVAQTLGYRSGRWELLWHLSLGTMIAVSIHVAGTVLVFAYLVLPAVAALFLSRRLGMVLLLSVLIAVLGTGVGVLLSVSPLDLPTSPTIVASLVALLLLSWLFRSILGIRGAK